MKKLAIWDTDGITEFTETEHLPPDSKPGVSYRWEGKGRLWHVADPEHTRRFFDKINKEIPHYRIFLRFLIENSNSVATPQRGRYLRILTHALHNLNLTKPPHEPYPPDDFQTYEYYYGGVNDRIE